MKLLHTSDWHLGRVFHNVSLLEDQAFILDQIIAYATDQQVDAVLIAGDIFDRAVPPSSAMTLLDDTLHRLTQIHNIPVILISGNHDSAERLAFGARSLSNQNLHIFHNIKDSNQAVTLTDTKGHGAEFYGIAYHAPEQVRSQFDIPVKTFDEAHTFLVQRILETPKNTDFRILLSHCFVDGAQECDSERPLAIGGADRVSAGPMKAFDYVALGHLHGQQKRGAEHIRYSGSPLKYSFSEERHNKAVTLVELSIDLPPVITQLPLTPLRNMRTLEGEMNALMAAGQNDPHSSNFLAITLTDKHALLDAMAKLRTVYPNVLQLEKTFLQNSHGTQHANKALQHNEQAMFADFFKEATGEMMDDGQKKYIANLLDQIHHEQTGGEA
ncbi:exonuclease SbcCD subunit D [Marinagarivorans algicola]|uniref:exonuclease SbcCD subunit D n=1 Tax=Marinagarivorans algicola TaxID=1513270 RepID=UPI0006B67FE1|nr:exonuclease SbcCD subunit D [Marinagarivorans algicola]